MVLKMYLLAQTIAMCICFNIPTNKTNQTILLGNPISNSANVKEDSLSKIRKKYSKHGTNHLSLVVPTDNAPDAGANYVDFEDVAYSQYTHHNMEDYFNELFEYSPINDAGTCGFVSLIQAMSYYDTFYNDNVIPEVFDCSIANTTPSQSTGLNSPGTLRQPFSGSGYANYYQFCNATQSTNFQSYLTVIYNTLLHTNNADDFHNSLGAWSYQDVLDSLYGNTTSVIVDTYSNLSQSEYVQVVKDIIDSGNPAIVHIEKMHLDGTTYDQHSVVAYEYDDDGIYANYGWWSTDTHQLLLGGQHEYTNIYYVASLDYSNSGHTHSDNYVAGNNHECGCNLSDKVVIFNGSNWKNVPPTLYWMKNLSDPTEYFRISFRSSENGSDIISYTTTHNEVTLSYNEWKTIVDACVNTVYISLKRISTYVTYNEQITTCTRPYSILSTVTISPSDYYGFHDSYPTSDEIRNNYYRHYLSNDFTFRTRRYRAGYIHNEYIVTSCIKTGITEAFIEYAFDTPIYKIIVDLSHWREYSYEWLDKYSGVSELQIWHERDLQDPLDTSRWVQKFDLLADETNLPRDRSNPTSYIINFDTPVYGFRFYSKINEARTSQANRGRICIGDLTLYLGESGGNNNGN